MKNKLKTYVERSNWFYWILCRTPDSSSSSRKSQNSGLWHLRSQTGILWNPRCLRLQICPRSHVKACHFDTFESNKVDPCTLGRTLNGCWCRKSLYWNRAVKYPRPGIPLLWVPQIQRTGLQKYDIYLILSPPIREKSCSISFREVERDSKREGKSIPFPFIGIPIPK